MRLPSKSDLVRLSRDRGAILKTALAVVAVAHLLGLAVSLMPKGKGDPHGVFSFGFVPRDVPGLVDFVRFGGGGGGGGSCEELSPELARDALAELVETALEALPGGDEAEAVRLWWRAIAADDGSGADAAARLGALPETTRRRDEFLADLSYLAGDADSARDLYVAEARRFPAAVYARRSALFLARYEGDREGLASLLEDPSFRSALSPLEDIHYSAAVPDHVGLAFATVRYQFVLLASSSLLPALFTAAIWFLILLSFQGRARAFLPAALGAFALGIVAAALAFYAGAVQETVRGFRAGEGDPEWKQFLYLLAGVSLREEVAKLLCFLPLALLLARRGTPLEALLLAGFVGLGFAFQENLVYFRGGGAGNLAWTRLLTANPLHFSLTGVAGLALWKVLHRRGRGWEDFLLVFLVVVFAHTVYNSVLTIPSLEEYAPLHPILVAVIAYQYFDPLRQHMEVAGLHRRLSPFGIFVVGSTLLTCTVLVSASFVLPFRFAAGAFATSLGAMIPLAFAFLSRFRDL